MGIEIFVEEGPVFSESPCPPVGHFGQPHVLPHCDVVRFSVLQEESDVHEEVDVIGLLDLIVLLSGNDEYFILGILGRKNVHFCVVEGGLDDVEFEWRERG